jgi:hypothetical protein
MTRQTYSTTIQLADMSIALNRTVRVPSGQTNNLPAGLGHFPIYKVADYKSGCPTDWKVDGIFFPIYRQEAMWMDFTAHNPTALIVASGNINAITGKPFDPTKAIYESKGTPNRNRKKSKNSNSGNHDLDIRLEDPQNYIIAPLQPWLDGWKAEDGKIYQFVAAELGSGETVEGQLTGEETHGGLQFISYKPKPSQNLVNQTRPHTHVLGNPHYMPESSSFPTNGYPFPHWQQHPHKKYFSESCTVLRRGGNSSGIRYRSSAPTSMGFGRGGEIAQKIYPDPYGLQVWEEKPKAALKVYMVLADDFKQITGFDAPPTPVTMETYQRLGIPWYELADKPYKDTAGSDKFAKLKEVGSNNGGGKAKGSKSPKASNDGLDLTSKFA